MQFFLLGLCCIKRSWLLTIWWNTIGQMTQYASFAAVIQKLWHTYARIVFSQSKVWSFLKQWLDLSMIDTVGSNRSLHNYWRRCCANIDRSQRKVFNDIMIYFWWNVWKDKNRRTFQNKTVQPRQVALLCKEEVEQYQLATRPKVQID
jgi:hypothetical protein